MNKNEHLTARLHNIMLALSTAEKKAQEQQSPRIAQLFELQKEVSHEIQSYGLFELNSDEINFSGPKGTIIERLYQHGMTNLLGKLIKNNPETILTPFSQANSVTGQYNHLLHAISQNNDIPLWHDIFPHCFSYIEREHITSLLRHSECMKFFIKNIFILNIVRASSGLKPLGLTGGDLCYQLYQQNCFDLLVEALQAAPRAMLEAFSEVNSFRSVLECVVYYSDRNLWDRIKEYCFPIMTPDSLLPILDNPDLFFDDFLYDIFQEVDENRPGFLWDHLIKYNNVDNIAAISLAAIRGHDKIFSFLVSKGASLDIRLHNNDSLLDSALLGLGLKYMRSFKADIFAKTYSISLDSAIEKKKKSYLKIIEQIYNTIQKKLTCNTPETAYDFRAYSRWGTPFISAIDSVEEAIVLKAHIMTQSCAKNNIYFSYDINTPAIKNGISISPLNIAIDKYLLTQNPELIRSGTAMLKTILKFLKPDVLSQSSEATRHSIYQLDRLPQEIVSLYTQRLKEQLEKYPEKKEAFFQTLEVTNMPYAYDNSYPVEEFQQAWGKLSFYRGKTPLIQAIDCGSEELFELLAQEWPRDLESHSFLGKSPIIYACLKTLDKGLPLSFFNHVLECYKKHNAKFWRPLAKLDNPYPNLIEKLNEYYTDSNKTKELKLLVHQNYLLHLHDEYESFMTALGYINPFLNGANILDLAFYWGNFSLLKSLIIEHGTLDQIASDSDARSPLIFLCQLEARFKNNNNGSNTTIEPLVERLSQAFELYQLAVNTNPELVSFLLGKNSRGFSVIDYCIENKCFEVLTNLMKYFRTDVIPALSLDHISIIIKTGSEYLSANNPVEAKKILSNIIPWSQSAVQTKKSVIDVINPSFYDAITQLVEHRQYLSKTFRLDFYLNIYLDYVRTSLSYDTVARMGLPSLLEIFADSKTPESSGFLSKLINKGLFDRLSFEALLHLLEEKQLFCEYDGALLSAAALKHGVRTIGPLKAFSFYLDKHEQALFLAFDHKLITSQDLYHLVTNLDIMNLSEKHLDLMLKLKIMLQQAKNMGRKNKASFYKKVVSYLEEQFYLLEAAKIIVSEQSLSVQQEPRLIEKTHAFTESHQKNTADEVQETLPGEDFTPIEKTGNPSKMFMIDSYLSNSEFSQALCIWNTLSEEELGELPVATNLILQVIAYSSNPSANEKIAFTVFAVSQNTLCERELCSMLSVLKREELSETSFELLHILQNLLEQKINDAHSTTADLMKAKSLLQQILQPQLTIQTTVRIDKITESTKQKDLDSLITATSSQLAPLLFNKRFDDALYCWERLPEFSRMYCDTSIKETIDCLNNGDFSSAEERIDQFNKNLKENQEKHLIDCANRLKSTADRLDRAAKRARARAELLLQSLPSQPSLKNPTETLKEILKIK